MDLLARILQGVFVMDGAMGTQIQARAVPADAWQGRDGCNELLNVTAPDIIGSIHRAYFEAGSDAVETNTFGASPITLGEYELSGRAREINRAAARLAREAAASFTAPEKPRFVFGSIGPGTRLPTLGQVGFDELRAALRVQIEGLLEGGADGILLETCQDLLQIKAGLAAYDDVVGRSAKVPLYVSVTVEQTGTLLIGSSIAAVVAALSPYPIHILGLNCATGPEAMRLHLDYLAANWPRLLACMPNAGLPEMKAGGVRYPLGPAFFAEKLGAMAREVGLNVVGGCCGTTPDHIRALAQGLRGFQAPARAARAPQQAASVFSPVDLTQDPPPLYIGERANATGSKKFRDALLADKYDDAFAVLPEQEEASAHVLDLSCAYAGRDEKKDMEILVARAARECRAPLMIDSTQADVTEAALKLYGGRALVNSINFESGEERARHVAGLARKFGAGLVCLTIDETGMAMTADRKVAIARRLVEFCEAEGIRRDALFVDTLTFTIGSGDPTLRTAALETLEAIRRIKKELPDVRTILGLSNISFGLKPAGRKVLNTVFLDRCLKAGMDACIINVASIVPLTDIAPDALRVAGALLDNDASAGDPLENFIRFFEGAVDAGAEAAAAALPPAEALARAVIKGRPQPLEAAIPALLGQHPAEFILNEILIPAMKEVGRLFNDGILQLPFVLKSAEVMKKAVDLLKPHMKKDESGGRRGLMVLATVAGDVHDIGKNLVDIILSNNGFHVVNLGTKIPIERMIAAVREHKADVLGMSGLLVKSAAIMAENMKALEAAGIRIPVFLGGAALTPGFVADSCQPRYSAPVVYCKDAFEGLARMRELSETGRLEKAQPRPPSAPPPDFEAPPVSIDLSLPPPKPPFLGHRITESIRLEDVYPHLNETALIRGRWGYRRGKMGAEEYDRLIEDEVKPRLEALKKQCAESGLFRPKAAHGWFWCRAEGEALTVFPSEGGEPIRMVFPRQSRSPGLSIPDFFRRDEDVIGFMVVTLGPGLETENARLLQRDHYQDYFLLHGLAVEVTDALAEYWHARMRAELGFTEPKLAIQDYIVQKYRGSRYGFGYPACPDLSMNKVCCDLVHAADIGVSLSDNFMMVPEVTTSALVAHHPAAKYFNV
ncbi:MAG TPA: methionine synthase [Kiritimatiellia bacterium]|nr:methionine synthase [Kiritimatiellia bacterium]HRZ11064.1 methionine synthase [Kiritimatiellia bacterium]HSA18637.1 methionine synthase [Kiritimatiellia bacterium]